MKTTHTLLLIFAVLISHASTTMAREFTVGPSLYNFNYSEYNTSNALLDEETGLIPGVVTAYYFENASDRFKFHLAYYDGTIDYDGQTQTGIPHQTDTSTKLLHIGAKVYTGYLQNRQRNFFASIEYRNWNRDILTRNNVQGLHEIYSWLEIAAGLHLETPMTDFSYYWVELSLKHTLNPEMEILLPSGDYTLNLGSEPGAKIEIGKTWQRTETLNITISAFLDYWEFGRSNTILINDFYGGAALVTEPRSESFHSGVALTFTRFF